MKPIKLTPEYIEEMTSEFKSMLESTNLAEGKINFVKSFALEKKDNEHMPIIYFTPEADAKQRWLIDHYDTEAAWNGLVVRDEEGNYIIEDILVGPQVVSAARVTVDQEPFDKWVMTISDEMFNKMHFQAHSHVNMSTGPSGTDMENQHEILAQLQDDDFYIFCIFNKKGDFSCRLYDVGTNRVYDENDVEIRVIGVGDLTEFCEDAMAKIRRPTNLATSTLPAVNASAPKKQTKTPAKSTKKKSSKEEALDLYDRFIVPDYDAFIFDHQYNYDY